MDVSKSADIVRLLDELHHEMYHKKYNDFVTNFNMSKDQLWILWKLRRSFKKKNKEYSVGELAKKFNVAHNTMSERISRLIDKGLVTRVQSSKDRRKYIIEINECGLNLLKRIEEEHKQLFALRISSNLNKDKVDKLAILLEELVTALREE